MRSPHLTPYQHATIKDPPLLPETAARLRSYRHGAALPTYAVPPYAGEISDSPQAFASHSGGSVRPARHLAESLHPTVQGRPLLPETVYRLRSYYAFGARETKATQTPTAQRKREWVSISR